MFFRFSGLAEDDSDKIMNTFSRVVPVLKYHDRWKTFCTAQDFLDILIRTKDFLKDSATEREQNRTTAVNG